MTTSTAASEVILHASTVAVRGRGVMIRGAAGSGKSSLALQLMGLGAELVADDRTRLSAGTGPVRVWADAPPTLPQKIEARGVGLLNAALAGPVPLKLVVDLETTVTERLPEPQSIVFFGEKVALIHNSDACPMAEAIVQFVKCLEHGSDVR